MHLLYLLYLLYLMYLLYLLCLLYGPQVSRARGCSAKSLVESVGSAASLFARRAAVNITLWFAVGVDAYDDARQGPYPIS